MKFVHLARRAMYLTDQVDRNAHIIVIVGTLVAVGMMLVLHFAK